MTRPREWIALSALWLVIAVAGVWSVFGRVPSTIVGSGLLLSAGGIREVEAQGAGTVAEITVREGELVERGTVIARIGQPQLVQGVEQARARLAIARGERRVRDQFLNANAALEAERLDAERRGIVSRATALEDRVRYLERRLTAEREARSRGLLTEAVVQGTVQELEQARSERRATDVELSSNTLARQLVDNRSREALAQADDAVREAERELAARQLALTQVERVVSTHRGYVREIRTNVGQLVAAGQSVASVEMADAPLEAVIFVSPEGKRIRPGMTARVSPVTVRQEEYGYIVGTVTETSSQPSTVAGIARTLGNDILVQQVAARGASFLVRVSLTPDTSTISGYRWSSRAGPPLGVATGTAVTVSVVVQRQRPIALILPWIRAVLGPTT